MFEIVEYSDEYYYYKYVYEKYSDALEEIDRRLGDISFNLTNIEAYLKRFREAEIDKNTVRNRPKTAYNYQHKKILGKIERTIIEYRCMVEELNNQRNVIKNEKKRYKELKEYEANKCWYREA